MARLLELSWGKGLVADLWNHQTLVWHFTTLLRGRGGTKQKPWFSLWQNSSFWRDVFQCRKKLEKRRRSTHYLPCMFWACKVITKMSLYHAGAFARAPGFLPVSKCCCKEEFVGTSNWATAGLAWRNLSIGPFLADSVISPCWSLEVSSARGRVQQRPSVRKTIRVLMKLMLIFLLCSFSLWPHQKFSTLAPKRLTHSSQGKKLLVWDSSLPRALKERFEPWDLGKVLDLNF